MNEPNELCCPKTHAKKTDPISKVQPLNLGDRPEKGSSRGRNAPIQSSRDTSRLARQSCSIRDEPTKKEQRNPFRKKRDRHLGGTNATQKVETERSGVKRALIAPTGHNCLPIGRTPSKSIKELTRKGISWRPCLRYKVRETQPGKIRTPKSHRGERA